ncbi:YfcE family phosphodiesterase [Brumimicrobium salinarum]|uniref:Phosphoesterase n=1 Tax=Brumimicrobium salinarum TaxID=2058658 RepID=A0A2I0R3M1_9FLAO|nr:metallophosphoesterase family protein [Brumimicrobium salinarum]PKR81000.1 YfcE family phosphodiesterase [Brumimicrobium salinarum]
MKIGLLSDTHSFLDERVFTYFKDVDEIWHAGDVGDITILEKLSAFKPLVGVYGNIDGTNIRRELPEFQRFERNGVEVLMTHIAGKPGKYSKPLLQEINKNGAPQLFICGHSHILLVKFDPKHQMLWLNPGACGNHGFHTVKTLLRFDLLSGEIKNLEVIEMGVRGKNK